MRVRVEVGPDVYQELHTTTAKKLIETVMQQLEHADLDDPETCQEAMEEIQGVYESLLDTTIGDIARNARGEDLPRPQKVRRLAGMVGGLKNANHLLLQHNDNLDAAMESLDA